VANGLVHEVVDEALGGQAEGTQILQHKIVVPGLLAGMDLQVVGEVGPVELAEAFGGAAEMAGCAAGIVVGASDVEDVSGQRCRAGWRSFAPERQSDRTVEQAGGAAGGARAGPPF
jgi:hypothetical protein